MRMRERGIGNLVFIAVLVLFLIAVALAFVFRDEADNLEQQLAQANQKVADSVNQLTRAAEAYDAVVEMYGAEIGALARTGQNYPSEGTIQSEVRKWLWETAQRVQTASEATVMARVWTPTPGEGITVTKGNPTKITLYKVPFTEATVDVQKVLAPLDSQFRWAAAAVSQNNELFEQRDEAAKTRVSELEAQLSAQQSKFSDDLSQKTQQADNFKNEADSVRDQVNELAARLDAQSSQSAQASAEWERRQRELVRDATAWKNRAIEEQEKKELALAEDPKDGEVLVADMRQGLVFINLGRKNRVSRGTVFEVWKPGKGDVRQNIAVVRVIDVSETKATCRILEHLQPRVPVAAGMNISNPFYDPHRPLTVYIYGDLRSFPTSVAKRRLAESGVNVSSSLHQDVDVIVLGEPPVSVSTEDVMDEDEGAAAERRMTMEREKNLRNAIEMAKSVGAVVVTEDVLRTFVEY